MVWTLGKCLGYLMVWTVVSPNLDDSLHNRSYVSNIPSPFTINEVNIIWKRSCKREIYGTYHNIFGFRSPQDIFVRVRCSQVIPWSMDDFFIELFYWFQQARYNKMSINLRRFLGLVNNLKVYNCGYLES